MPALEPGEVAQLAPTPAGRWFAEDRRNRDWRDFLEGVAVNGSSQRIDLPRLCQDSIIPRLQ